jgi:hypothetical protein
LSIKNYTLSEIGVFYKAIVLLERETKIDQIYNQWISTHCDQETVINLIKNLDKKSKIGEKPEKKPEDVQKEWNRLNSFMKKRK